MTNSQFPPHQLTKHTKLLHKVSLVFSNKVLIVKRAVDTVSRPGKWDLPGGNSEWPQEDAAGIKIDQDLLNPHQKDIVREIKEETGLVVDPTLFVLDRLAFFATFFEQDKQVYSINCGWIVSEQYWLSLNNEPKSDNESITKKAPKITLSSEHTDYSWITLSELDQYDFGGADRNYETALIKKALS